MALCSFKYRSVSDLVKMSLFPRHSDQHKSNYKSDEFIASEESSIVAKNEGKLIKLYQDKNNTGISSSDLILAGYQDSDGLQTGAESSDKLTRIRSVDSVSDSLTDKDKKGLIDVQLGVERNDSGSGSHHLGRNNRSLKHTLNTTKPLSGDKSPSIHSDTVFKREFQSQSRFIIQDEHFRVNEEGYHEHMLKPLPLIQDSETHKTWAGFFFSAVFKRNKHENEEPNFAMSILPLNDSISSEVLVDSTNEQTDFDENYGHKSIDVREVPKIVNENAAIGKDELKLINNLAERINNGIGQLSKCSSTDLSAKVKHSKAKQILAEKYGKCIGMVGHGAYGTVWVTSKEIDSIHDDSSLERPYRDTFEHNGKRYYAIKELKPRVNESHEKFSARLTSEFVIGHSLSGKIGIVKASNLPAHPNILKVLDLLQTHDAFVEVFEFCPSGDLYSLLTRSSKSGSPLHPLEADCFMKQLLNGVQYMHNHGVAHCDLKPENILFTPSGVLKICDFGLSSVFQTAWEKQVHFQTGKVGSEPYVAPEEFIPEKEYDCRLVDCWSCGIIYCTMVFGHYLWKVANKEKDQIYKTFIEEMTKNGEYSAFEELRHVNQELNRCRKMCLYNIFQWEPKKRISISKLLDTPWIRKTACCVNYYNYSHRKQT